MSRLTNLQNHIVEEVSKSATVTTSNRRGFQVHRYHPGIEFPEGRKEIEITLEYEWFYTCELGVGENLRKSFISEAEASETSSEWEGLVIHHEVRASTPQAVDSYLDDAASAILNADATLRLRKQANRPMTWGTGSVNIELPYERPAKGLGQRIEFNMNSGAFPFRDLANAAASGAIEPIVPTLNPFWWLHQQIPTLDLLDLQPRVEISKIRRKFTFDNPTTGDKCFAVNIDEVTASKEMRQVTYCDVEMAIETDINESTFAISRKLAEKFQMEFGLIPNDLTRYQRASRAVAK